VAGGGPVARRIFEAEALLNQGEIASESLVNEVAAICASVVEPTGDSNGSEAYRRTIIQQLVIKAMKEVTAHEYQR
jgi:CO/xanthine dehydrogenase FAD-binding subunit